MIRVIENGTPYTLSTWHGVIRLIQRHPMAAVFVRAGSYATLAIVTIKDKS